MCRVQTASCVVSTATLVKKHPECKFHVYLKGSYHEESNFTLIIFLPLFFLIKHGIETVIKEHGS